MSGAILVAFIISHYTLPSTKIITKLLNKQELHLIL